MKKKPNGTRVKNCIALDSSDNFVGKEIKLVKQAGADTTVQNAVRDGAEWAWVPSGDSCAFCIALASRGWETASQKALKGNHAQHIHANCDCTYAIRFDGESKYESYNPAKYKEIYDNASDGNSYEKINAIRREQYKLNKDEINASKRINYESLKSRKESGAVAKSGKDGIIADDRRTPTNPTSGEKYTPHTIKIDSTQFGNKTGKHAQDYGLNPSSPEDRDILKNTINDITENADERYYGEWRGQEYPVLFHIKGKDVVIENIDGEFVTIMKGGIANERVKNARK